LGWGIGEPVFPTDFYGFSLIEFLAKNCNVRVDRPWQGDQISFVKKLAPCTQNIAINVAQDIFCHIKFLKQNCPFLASYLINIANST
jgi:hypothetical protein